MQDFTIKFNYKQWTRRLIEMGARRVGSFIETVYNGKVTFKVDFNLSGGYYYGWTIIEMAETAEGCEALMWVLSKDFPNEVKEHITKVLRGK